MNKLLQLARAFAQEDEGAQIIEYALIVAVVSLGLMLLIQSGLLANGGSFQTWLTDVGSCLTSGTCTRSGGGAGGAG